MFADLGLQPPSLVVVVALLYVAVGVGVAGLLMQRGASAGSALAAVGAWPLLLSALDRSPPAVATAQPGPLGEPIVAAFVALEAALADPAASGVPFRTEVDGLRDALLRADERIGLVDRLLRDTAAPADPDIARSHQALTEARDHAAAEIEGVLSGVVQLRLQVGLLALAGDAVGIADRLRQLRARVTAIEEVEGLG